MTIKGKHGLLGIVLLASLGRTQTTVEVWQQTELTFHSSKTYSSPLLEVDLMGLFISDSGDTLRRPAFWDGEGQWKIRFAPTRCGIWQYTLAGREVGDFTGPAAGTLQAVPYCGSLETGRNGFLKISSDHRRFTYDNGRPFFYLADTHWFLPLEKWEECNAPDCTSQFKFMVDERARQGFTVYQVQTNGKKMVSDSVTSVDLEAFRDLDRKFDYLASRGFVINTSIGSAHSFALVLGIHGAERLAKYWVARYGAYPVLWMTAQEVDLDHNRYIEIWKAAARTIAAFDDYHHPHSAHLWDNSNPARFDREEWHTFHMIQGGHIIWGGGTQVKAFYEHYFEHQPIKPMLESEANYEGLGKERQCTTTDIRNAAYKSILCGSPGFGYGVQGIWQDCYTPAECGCCMEWGTQSWLDALCAPGGEQMRHLREFFASLAWERLVPRFDDPAWIEIAGTSAREREKAVLATVTNQIYLLYLYSDQELPVMLKGLDPGRTYQALWFDPRQGKYLKAAAALLGGSSNWRVPAKPTPDDYLLVLSTLP
ncbi:MAG TPA: DUF4038 domain-containing protein [bacterium]|nr:DUF4038 domain-containing protein [bacterium]HPR89444.1 DUF4038 domain-containing protein [bacterium]